MKTQKRIYVHLSPMGCLMPLLLLFLIGSIVVCGLLGYLD